MTPPIRAAFDQGQVPTIACFNKAVTPLGLPVDFVGLVGALQAFLDQHFAPVWGTPATLHVSQGFVPGAWALAFLESADVAGALGYHDLTPEGLPLSKVFVQTTVADLQSVSVTASHELCEMLVDPAINLMAVAPRNVMYAYEVCDACEEVDFPVAGVRMSDFVTPAWFESFRAPDSAKFDHAGQIRMPFGLLPGGYAIIFRKGRWANIFGSHEKAKRFAREDRRGHRSSYREKPISKWKPSVQAEEAGAP